VGPGFAAQKESTYKRIIPILTAKFDARLDWHSFGILGIFETREK
jgi:hypothetical protein